MSDSLSFELAKGFLNKEVAITIDRPLGTTHPRHNFTYGVNYGYIAGVKAPDGEDLDAYYLGVDQPVTEGKGIVIAIVHRLTDDDDKLIVAPAGMSFSDEEIEKQVMFQERWFVHEIVR